MIILIQLQGKWVNFYHVCMYVLDKNLKVEHMNARFCELAQKRLVSPDSVCILTKHLLHWLIIIEYWNL
jgi:hypothetical protein